MSIFSWLKKKPEPQRDPAACSDDASHYSYSDVGWPYPACMAMEYIRAEQRAKDAAARRQDERDNALAEKVAGAVIRALIKEQVK